MRHNEQMFGELFRAAAAINPSVRAARTFGWPALYVESRIVACVFGDAICLKVPEALADQALASGHFRRFRPYGMPTSPYWIDGGRSVLVAPTGLALLRAALEAQATRPGVPRHETSPQRLRACA